MKCKDFLAAFDGISPETEITVANHYGHSAIIGVIDRRKDHPLIAADQITLMGMESADDFKNPLQLAVPFVRGFKSKYVLNHGG